MQCETGKLKIYEPGSAWVFGSVSELQEPQILVLLSKHCRLLQKLPACFDDPDTSNILCSLMRDSCGLQGNYRWRGEHTHTHMQAHKSKQSHTRQHTHRVMDTLRNG